MIDQFSVRTMVLIGCGFNLAGAFVKLFAFKSNLFPILFIGQVLSQVTWTVINQIGGKLANQSAAQKSIFMALNLTRNPSGSENQSISGRWHRWPGAIYGATATAAIFH